MRGSLAVDAALRKRGSLGYGAGALRGGVFGRGYYVSPAQRGLVEAFAEAVRAEAASKAAVTAAQAALKTAATRAAELARQLMDAGVPSTKVAFHATRALGVPADGVARRRAAARWRKQVSRLVTRGHGFRSRALGRVDGAHLTLNGKEANDMVIVHRKITEEWIEDPEAESLDDADCDDEDCEDDAQENGTRQKRTR